MAVQSRAALKTDKNTNFADNATGDISALDLRNEFEDLLDSVYIPGDDNTADTQLMTAAEKAKLGFVTITQGVDLDQMEIDIAALANGMVYQGDWDASVGTFPGGGAAQTGWFYYVSVAGTVGGVEFAVGDNIVAVTDNASTATYAANWSKHDQTDAVQAVVGLTGSISKAALLSALNVEDGATADQTNGEIETAYNAQVAAASQGEMEAGTEAAVRRMSPLRVAQAIAALASGGATEVRYTIHNATGGVLTKGTPVYISGFNTGNGVFEAAAADADGSGTMPVVGIVSADIADASTGLVVAYGLVTGLNTAGMTIGNPLYVSTTGTLTETPPATGVVQEVARVTRTHATLGEIAAGVRVSGEPLNNDSALSDVNGNEVLQFGVVAAAVNHLKASNATATNKAKLEAVGGDTHIGIHLAGKGDGEVTGVKTAIIAACGDETTDMTTGVAKITFRMPHAFTLTEVRGSLVEAATGATLFQFDVNENGTTIFSTEPTFNASAETTVGATTPAVISDANLADDAEITVDVTAVGNTTAGKGLKVSLIGYIPE